MMKIKIFILAFIFEFTTYSVSCQTCSITATSNSICQGTNLNLGISTSITNPTSYSWSNSQTSNSILVSPTSSVSYTCTVSDGTNSCTTSPFLLTVNPLPSLSPISNQTFCNNINTSTITFNSTISGSTFSWTNSNSNIGLPASGVSSISSYTATNTSNSPIQGSINVIPTANGCAGVSQNFTITVNPTPSISNTLNSQSVCNGQLTTSVPFSSNVSGTTFNWTNNNTNIGLPASGSGNINSFNGTNNSNSTIAGTIIVTPLANSCSGNSQTFIISIKPIPILSSIPNATYCNNQTTNSITFNSNVVGTTFAWTNSNSTIGVSASGNSSIPSFTATNPSNSPIQGTISVTPSANGCIGTSLNIIITVNPTPSISNTLNSQSVCNGQLTATVPFSSNVSGTTFNWTNNNINIGLPASGSGNINSFNGTNNSNSTIAGTVIVTPMANSCIGLNQSFEFSIKPSPLSNAGNDMTINCNQNVNGAIIGMTPVIGIQYYWSPIIGVYTSNSSSTLVNPNATTNYFLTAYNAQNGCSSTDSVTIIVNNTLPQVSTGNVGTITCNQNTTGVQIGGTNTPGMNYSWTPTNGLTSINQSQTTANPSNTTTYTLTVMNPINGCTSSGQVTVNVNNTPPLANAGLDAIITCNQNINGVSLGMNTISGLDYNWSPSTGLNSSNIANVIANPSITATYTFTVSNPSNGCTASDNITVFVDNNMPTVNAGLDQSICDGSSVTLSGTSNASNIQWSPSSVVSNPGALNSSANIQGTTTFTLTATGSNGCTNSDYVIISVHELPQSGLSNNYSVCTNDFLQLNVNPTLNCQWSGLLNSTSNAINQQADTSGILLLEITDINGCSSTEEITIDLLPIPYPVIAGAGILCQNSYWVKYNIPSTSNFLHWSIVNGEFQSDSTSNEVYVHWDSINPSNQIIGQIIIEETVASTGCHNSFIKNVLLDTTAALNPATVLSLSSNVLYIANDYTFMNWGYESILTHIPVSVGVYSQYCDFNNLDVSNYNYWVEIGDGNGCITKSYYNEPIFTADLENQDLNEFKVFPNPTEHLIYIQTNIESSFYQIQTLNGSVLKSGVGTDEFSINVIDLPSGVYILNLNNGTRHYQTKIIKL